MQYGKGTIKKGYNSETYEWAEDIKWEDDEFQDVKRVKKKQGHREKVLPCWMVEYFDEKLLGSKKVCM